MACPLCALACDAVEQFFVGLVFIDALSYRSDGLAEVFGYLFLQVAVAQGAVVPFLVEIVERVGCGAEAEESEKIFYHFGPLAVGCLRSHVGHGLHHLFLDGLVVVGQIDAVAFALAHFAAAVESGHFQRFLGEIEILGFGEEFHPVDIVEPACASACHFHILLLVFSHRHFLCTVLQDVGSHQGGVGEQSGVHVVGLFACLFLEGGHTFQFAQIGVHVQKQVEFQRLFHVALHIDGSFFRVEPACQVFGQDSPGAVLYVIGFGVGGKAVPIGNEEQTVVFILHFHKTLHCAVIIAKMQVSGWPDAANYFFHLFFVLFFYGSAPFLAVAVGCMTNFGQTY